MTAPDLKPCPFCGHRAETQEYGTRTEVWAVWCVECKAQMESISTEAEAIAAWNTRTTPLAEALAVVKAWAMENFVSDGCKLMEDRSPGCLSCDTLHFIEAMEDELADAALRAIGDGKA